MAILHELQRRTELYALLERERSRDVTARQRLKCRDLDVQGFVQRELRQEARDARVGGPQRRAKPEQLRRHVAQVVAARRALLQEAVEVLVEQRPEACHAARDRKLHGFAQIAAHQLTVHVQALASFAEGGGVGARDAVLLAQREKLLLAQRR